MIPTQNMAEYIYLYYIKLVGFPRSKSSSIGSNVFITYHGSNIHHVCYLVTVYSYSCLLCVC